MSKPGVSPRQFSTAFKEEVVLRLKDERLAAVAASIGVKRKLLYEWREAYQAKGLSGFNRKRGRKVGWRKSDASEARASSARSPSGSLASAARASDDQSGVEARIAELERVIGRQAVELHFFQLALRLWDATNRNAGAPTSTRSSSK